MTTTNATTGTTGATTSAARSAASANQLKRLQDFQKQKSIQSRVSSMVPFDTVGVYLGVKPKEYFPKLRDENGEVVKDSNGSPVRSKEPMGYIHTFSEVTTSKMIKVVRPHEFPLSLMSPFRLTGLGYDIKSANMVFIEKEGMIESF